MHDDIVMTVLSQTERDRFQWMKILLSLTFLITCVSLITSTISLTTSKKSFDLQTDIHNEISALTLNLHESHCELHKVIKLPDDNSEYEVIILSDYSGLAVFMLLIVAALMLSMVVAGFMA